MKSTWSRSHKFAALLPVVAAIVAAGCSKGSNPQSTNREGGTSPETGTSEAPAPVTEELAKPAAGKGNVQGKVLYNDKPAANIQVTLTENFSPFLGASGKEYTARTDKNGDYVIKNVPPKQYEGLTARVFQTDAVIFIKSGIVSAKTYAVEADKTLFVDPTNLFKSDLKVLAPKASATQPAQATFKWQAYPDATYYKIGLYADDAKVSTGVYGERVDGTTYQPAKPLPAGGYRLTIEAYNTNDHKLAEGPEQYKFKVAP